LISKNDLRYTREPICPYCGNKDRDAWEYDFGDMEGTIETDCGNCGKEYYVTRNVEITYSTTGKE